jgi:farnesol kinase
VPFLTKQLMATRRPNEVFSWASTMFIIAALLILWLTPLPVALAALAMLGFGDGISALVGRAIGRNKLWYNPRKSWEGSTAGFLAGAIGALALTAWYYAAVGLAYPFMALVPICIAGALAATIAESLPQWEDNFSVPIASSVTMTILWVTAGLSPTFGPAIEYLVRFAGWA